MRDGNNCAIDFISQSFQVVWRKFGMLWELCSLMNLILILLRFISIQGRELYWGNFVMKKKRN